MPTYDYRCEANGNVYEVRHPMSSVVSTWAELCELGDFDPNEAPGDTRVTKLLTTAGIVKSSALKNPEAPPCMTGGGCSSGGCGI